jgi:hypothetical protein
MLHARRSRDRVPMRWRIRLTTSRHLLADFLENVGASTSHNPMGLHGLLQGYLYLFQYNILNTFCWFASVIISRPWQGYCFSNKFEKIQDCMNRMRHVFRQDAFHHIYISALVILMLSSSIFLGPENVRIIQTLYRFCFTQSLLWVIAYLYVYYNLVSIYVGPLRA